MNTSVGWCKEKPDGLGCSGCYFPKDFRLVAERQLRRLVFRRKITDLKVLSEYLLWYVAVLLYFFAVL